MNSLNNTFIKAHGLNARRIRLHQRRILQALKCEINTDISIQSACTTQNGSIIPWEIANQTLNIKGAHYQEWQKNHIVSCLPAAGAASRFFVELQSFVTHVSQQLLQEHTLDVASILSQFPFIERLIHHIIQQKNLAIKPKIEPIKLDINTILMAYSFSNTLMENYSHKPKLVVPATLEEDSFLKLKMIEQTHLFSCLGTALVVPNTFKKEIQGILYQLNPKEYEKWLVLEQDHKLSTIRFNRDGSPFLDVNGQYSLVSAGHGELLHLFDNISDHFPQAHCLHIRNIDNIIGDNLARKSELNVPAYLFYELRTILEFIRKKIPLIDFNFISEIQDSQLYEKLSFISQLIYPPEEISLFKESQSISCSALYNLLSKLFHWPSISKDLTAPQIWKLILENCERPLSVFGVVKKEKGDVGGGPVFAKVSDGSTVKLCMEMPHASPEDSKEYFSDRGKTTHFNPALVFFEIKTHTDSTINTGKKVNFVQLFDERFWILSKREYKEQPVCYHETVLYELIGNSATTNLVFIEVPRSLFKPHKSYLDCLEQNRTSYGFNENFSS